MALAGPGEVLISATTAELAAGTGMAFEFRGSFELKGLSGPRPVFSATRCATPEPVTIQRTAEDRSMPRGQR
jgi:class 3 adenylate cyclase